MTKFSAILIVGAAMLAGTIAAAQENSSDRMTVAWSDPSRPGLLKVDVFSGAVSVKAYGGKDVIIQSRSGKALNAGIRNRPQPPETAGLRRIDSGTGPGLHIEEEKNVMTIEGSIFQQAVDLDIQVPVKTNLNIQTMNGQSIVVDGIDGDIEVTALNGPVTLTNVSGSVMAHSMNSKVVVSLREVSGNKPMSVSSMNGVVDLTLPANTKANLKMRAESGEIYSDFDIKMGQTSPPTIEDSRSRGGRLRADINKTIDGTINNGGPDIELRTINGNIYIRKAK
jgi:hypothetical protein